MYDYDKALIDFIKSISENRNPTYKQTAATMFYKRSKNSD